MIRLQGVGKVYLAHLHRDTVTGPPPLFLGAAPTFY